MTTRTNRLIYSTNCCCGSSLIYINKLKSPYHQFHGLLVSPEQQQRFENDTSLRIIHHRVSAVVASRVRNRQDSAAFKGSPNNNSNTRFTLPYEYGYKKKWKYVQQPTKLWSYGFVSQWCKSFSTALLYLLLLLLLFLLLLSSSSLQWENGFYFAVYFLVSY